MNRWRIRQAVRTVRAGGIIAYPTEAVYGLGCDPLNGAAVLRLLDLKRRPVDKGLILIASRFEQLLPFLAPLPRAMLAKVQAGWPGPVTWLLPARPETPSWLRGTHATLAVRITAHPMASALCDAAGAALVSTSANRGGRPPARNALQVHLAFGGDIDYVVHGATGGHGKPTEIRSAVTGKVVRAG